MFQKLVAIEPVSLVPSAEKALYSFAGQVVMYPDIPANDDEIIARIGDADAVLLSYTSRINRYVLECCPNVKYIGMCCSLYSPESANVDIRYANERGITVTGIRDYGDEGVVEYVVSLLIRRFVGERRRSLLRFESHSFDRFIHLLANWEYQDIILSQGAELPDRLHHHFDDVGVESTTKRSV